MKNEIVGVLATIGGLTLVITLSTFIMYGTDVKIELGMESPIVHVGDVTDIPPPPFPRLLNNEKSIMPHLRVVANIIRERGNISDYEAKALKFLSTEYQEGDKIYESLDAYLEANN
ncbi:MAG TPA: hypothetical protein EYQ68_07955 [Cytophagales bacterium]|jgi:hypothetical protein|nr:hypothetical protein [Cytophagales bacterium]